MSDTKTAARYRFAPQDRTGWLLGLTGPQCLLLAAGLTAGGVTLPVSPPAALAVLCAAAIAAFATWDHQPAHRQVSLRVGWTLRRRSGRTTWTSPRPYRASSAPSWPKTFGRLRFWHAPAHGWGERTVVVIEDRAAHNFTILLPVAGRGFALRETEEQERLLAGWGELLGGFTSSRHPVVRIAVAEWAGPATTLTSADSDGAALNPQAAAVYAELVAAAGPASSLHHSVLALTVAPTRRGQRKKGPSPADGVTIAVEQARLLANRLDGIGVEVGAPLPPTDAAVLLRHRLDPTSRHRAVSGRLDLAGPMALRASWDHTRIDRSCHAVFWVAEWPRLPVPPGWLEPLLLHPGGTRTLTFVFEPVTAGEAVRQVRRDATRLAADQQQRERGGWRVDAHHQRTRAEVEQREAELAAGYAELNYLALLTVTAPSPDALVTSCRDLEDVATQVGLELRRLDGQHDLALPAAIGILGRPVPKPRLR